MARIQSSSDLRNKYHEISEFCNTYQEPVYITRNGRDDLVVLSNAEYERLCGRFDLARLLDEGLTDMEQGRFRPATEAFAAFEERYER